MLALLRTEPKTACVVAVVLNWNSWADTILCLESLLESERPPDQIVVCDNGSSDNSLEFLATWARAQGRCEIYSCPDDALASVASAAPIVIIPIGENAGYAAGNNVGIRFATQQCGAEYVWVLNNDVVVERAALARMLDVALANPEAGIVGAKLLRFDEPDVIQALGGGYLYPVLFHDTQLGAGRKASSVGREPIQLDHIVGASLLVRADAIARVGLIDESYFLYREETDWCIRMRRDGWQLVCCTEAVVWHKQSRSIGFKSPLHDYYAVRNMLHLVRKFYPAALPAAIGYHGFRALAPKLARLQFARLGAVLSAMRDFALGVSGRAHDHTDRVLMHNYGIEPVADATAAPRTPLMRRIAASAAMLALLAMAAALTNSASTAFASAPHQRDAIVASHYRLTPSTPDENLLQ